jgi:hypothetical protein
MSKPDKPSITLKPVKSSQIEAIGYDKETNTLAIKFKSGGVYHYSNVTQKHYDDLAGKGKKASESHSIGSHFYKHIKANREQFPFTRLP